MQARAIVWLKLDDLKNWLSTEIKQVGDESAKAHYLFAVAQISEFQNHPKEMHLSIPLTPPAGQPIGMEDAVWCSFDWANQ